MLDHKDGAVIDPWFFSRAEMKNLAEKLKNEFSNAEPFPHVVIDNFFPEEVARRIGEEYPGISDIDWALTGPGDTGHTGNPRIEKVSSSDEEQFPPFIRFIIYQFQSGIFCEFLDHLTGFSHLAPDPSHRGCGLHSTGNGGRLMLHIDASRHPNRHMNQLINCIYYCSPEWKPEFGGGLELWNEDATECVKTVEPLFNRLVIFFTAGKSWHGHPRPVQCPEGMRRNSLALYFYTTDKNATDLEIRDYVQWRKTYDFEEQSRFHRIKCGLRDNLPTPVFHALSRAWNARRRR